MNKRKYFCIIVVLITAVIISFTFILVNNHKGGRFALITSDGEVIEKIDLENSPDRTIVIKNSLGSNTIVVKNGEISVVDADCPDKKCVSMGELKSIIAPIVCLPHKLIISLSEQ